MLVLRKVTRVIQEAATLFWAGMGSGRAKDDYWRPKERTTGGALNGHHSLDG